MCEAEQSPPSRGGIKNAWSNTFMGLCLVEQRK
jgi:hypothetical protein